jgi:hypothetical protein
MEGAYHSNEGHNAKSNEVLILDVQKILEELQRTTEDSLGTGITCRQISDAMGWEGRRSQMLIRKALEAGLCTRGQRRREEGIDGVLRPIPTYVFKL